jgi:hypothetical protein
MTKFTFKGRLRNRAFPEAQLTSLAGESDFKVCEIVRSAVGMEVKFTRRQPLAEQAA